MHTESSINLNTHDSIQLALTEIQALNLQYTESISTVAWLADNIPQFLWQNEILLHHTDDVIRVFYKYFKEKWTSSVVLQEFFVLLLLFHDIWKPQASNDWHRNMQHAYSEKIIRDFFSDFWCNKRDIELWVSLTCIDPIWTYLQWKTTLDETLAVIATSYTKVNSIISFEEFFDLLAIYYICDASTYPMLRDLFTISQEEIWFAPEQQSKIDLLTKKWQKINNSWKDEWLWLFTWKTFKSDLENNFNLLQTIEEQEQFLDDVIYWLTIVIDGKYDQFDDKIEDIKKILTIFMQQHPTTGIKKYLQYFKSLRYCNIIFRHSILLPIKRALQAEWPYKPFNSREDAINRTKENIKEYIEEVVPNHKNVFIQSTQNNNILVTVIDQYNELDREERNGQHQIEYS